MRIKQLKIIDHPTLGNLDLDFCNKNTREIYKNIVFVGENGTGKTTILDTLSDIKWLLLGGSNSRIDVGEYNFDVEATIVLLDPMPLPWMGVAKINNSVMMSEITIRSERVVDGKSKHERIRRIVKVLNKNGQSVDLPKNPLQLNPPPYIRGSIIYSKAGINYKRSENHLYTTNMQIDSPSSSVIKSDESTCDKVNNIMSSIFIQDAIGFYKCMKDGRNYTQNDSRIDRFVDAYKKIFGDDVDIVDVDKNNNVIIELNGGKIPLNSLSSGQKQIVFRAGDLLGNKGVLFYPVVLIDEPEISLHPKWQQHIYDFYKQLFVNENNKQNAQIFMATHSEYVLHDAMNDSQSLILALNLRQAPKVIPHNEGYLSSYGRARYEIFGISTVDYHDELWANLMERESIATVSDMDKFLTNKANNNEDFLKSWQGYKDGQKNEGGSTKSLPAYIRNFSHHPEYTKPIDKEKCNELYTESELMASIEFMRQLLNEEAD